MIKLVLVIIQFLFLINQIKLGDYMNENEGKMSPEEKQYINNCYQLSVFMGIFIMFIVLFW